MLFGHLGPPWTIFGVNVKFEKVLGSICITEQLLFSIPPLIWLMKHFLKFFENFLKNDRQTDRQDRPIKVNTRDLQSSV